MLLPSASTVSARDGVAEFLETAAACLAFGLPSQKQKAAAGAAAFDFLATE